MKKLKRAKRPIVEIPLGLCVELVNCPGASNHGRWWATYRAGEWPPHTIFSAHAGCPIEAAAGVVGGAGVTREQFLGRGTPPGAVRAREAFAWVCCVGLGVPAKAVSKFLGKLTTGAERYQRDRARTRYEANGPEHGDATVREVYDQLLLVTKLQLGTAPRANAGANGRAGVTA